MNTRVNNFKAAFWMLVMVVIILFTLWFGASWINIMFSNHPGAPMDQWEWNFFTVFCEMFS
jgi:hypothetical protein